jgi:hypothetical protein
MVNFYKLIHIYEKLLNKAEYVEYGRLLVHIRGIIIDETETINRIYEIIVTWPFTMLSPQNKLVLNQRQGQLWSLVSHKFSRQPSKSRMDTYSVMR